MGTQLPSWSQPQLYLCAQALCHPSHPPGCHTRGSQFQFEFCWNEAWNEVDSRNELCCDSHLVCPGEEQVSSPVLDFLVLRVSVLLCTNSQIRKEKPALHA